MKQSDYISEELKAQNEKSSRATMNVCLYSVQQLEYIKGCGTESPEIKSALEISLPRCLSAAILRRQVEKDVHLDDLYIRVRELRRTSIKVSAL